MQVNVGRVAKSLSLNTKRKVFSSHGMFFITTGLAVLAGFIGLKILDPQSVHALTACTPAAPYNTCLSYTLTRTDQPFTVPTGVSSIKVQAWGAGAGGGRAGTAIGGPGGSGGYVEGLLNVTPGSQYVVMVGEGGPGDGTGQASQAAAACANGGYGFGGRCAPLRTVVT